MANSPRSDKSSLATKLVTFRTFVETAKPPLPKVLPLVHMTDSWAALRILESGTIEPKICRHFSALLSEDEPLSFFFYGRPAYRPRPDISSTNNGAKYPVALIIAFDSTVHSIKRIFPFDTGACFEGLYKSWIDERMKVMDFCLGGNVDAAQKSVAKFFKTNENYINGSVLEKIRYDVAEFEVANYHSMLKNSGDTKIDSRKSSIEVQFEKPIELAKTKVLGVVLPETQMGSQMFQALLAPYNVDPIPYTLTGGSTIECGGALIAESVKLLRGFL